MLPPDDAKAYLLKVGNLASYKSQVCEVNAWTEKYGKLRRTHITAAQVRQARSDWLAEGYPEDRQQPRTDVPVVIPPAMSGASTCAPADSATASEKQVVRTTATMAKLRLRVRIIEDVGRLRRSLWARSPPKNTNRPVSPGSSS